MPINDNFEGFESVDFEEVDSNSSYYFRHSSECVYCKFCGKFRKEYTNGYCHSCYNKLEYNGELF